MKARLCLEPHDLAVSKLVAGREKDRVFLSEMRRHHMLDDELIRERIAMLPVSGKDHSAVTERWDRIVRAMMLMDEIA